MSCKCTKNKILKLKNNYLKLFNENLKKTVFEKVFLKNIKNFKSFDWKSARSDNFLWIVFISKKCMDSKNVNIL